MYTRGEYIELITVQQLILVNTESYFEVVTVLSVRLEHDWFLFWLLADFKTSVSTTPNQRSGQ